MASIWNFVRRHRGKLIVGGAVAGGFYAVRRYFQEHPEAWDYYVSNLSAGRLSEIFGRKSEEAQGTQPERKNYLFDSNQRTCDGSIMQLVPSIQRKIQEKFNVEKLADDLKNGRFENEQEKLELWNKMKVQCLARVLSATYGYSLLIAALKAQMSILTSTIYEQSQRNKVLTRTTSGLFDIMSRWGGGDPNLSSRDRASDDSATDQQLFLQCIQYFVVQGIEHLMEKVELLMWELCRDISLKDHFSPDRVRDLLGEARRLLETGDCRNFSYFVVPITASLDVFAAHSERLQELLMNLKGILESESCRKLIWEFGERFADEITGFFENNSESESTPMARVVPIFADCFHTISSLQQNAVIRGLLASDSLYQFCMKIFNGDIHGL